EYTEDEKRSGKMSALLRPVTKEKFPVGTFTDAEFCGDAPFPGFATRVTAFIKGDAGGIVRFWVSENLSGATGDQDSSLGSLQRRGGNWNKHEVVSVPPPGQGAGKQRMCVLLGVEGSNRAWIDDVTFTKLDLQTIPAGQPLALENLDMETSQRGTLKNWALNAGLASPPKEGFELIADSKTKRSGRSSLRLTTDVPLQQPPGDSADYCLDVNPVLGETLRIAGWIKTDVAEGAGGVFGISAFPFTAAEVPTITPEVVLERGDSYATHVFIRNAPDWSQYEVITFVPKSTVNLCIEIRLDQVGSVWADDLTVEVIDL
ncbi:MAG TPA: hypothetical protein VND22_05610, partial [Actinomycetota bacterium]|nr:hypothetical protein [Actinomycetota bacterium]